MNEGSGSAEDHYISWKIKDNRIYFNSLKSKKDIINSGDLILKMPRYAEDIEKIVW
jgi:hypothetical protein